MAGTLPPAPGDYNCAAAHSLAGVVLTTTATIIDASAFRT